MKKLVSIFRASIWLRICTICAILLLVASFIVPPLGVIDNSVLAGAGEIFGFASLWLIYAGLEKGVDAKIKHNGTEVTLTNDNNYEEVSELKKPSGNVD